MHRSLLRSCWFFLSLIAAGGMVASQGGCRNFLATAVYFIKGTEVKPEFPGLKDKKVAVVCRSANSLQFGASSVATDLATAVGVLLKRNGSRIRVIPQRDVQNWIDENSRGDDDTAGIGEALNAEMVLGIELEAFDLSEGQTLWKGESQVRMKVLDMSISDEHDRVVFDKIMPHVVYPPNGIPVQERSEDEFRREYIGVLADAIGRYFYSHDPRENFAQDAAALQP
jgi:hypothetical protein